MDGEAIRTPPIATSLRVPFRDVDMHGHVHNAAYIAYCEEAINDVLRGHGLLGHLPPGGGAISYLVRKVDLLFERPSRFGDILEPRVELAKVGASSLRFTVDLRVAGETTPRVIATIVWVCVDVASMRSTAIPDEIVAALSVLMPGRGPESKEQ